MADPFPDRPMLNNQYLTYLLITKLKEINDKITSFNLHLINIFIMTEHIYDNNMLSPFIVCLIKHVIKIIACKSTASSND